MRILFQGDSITDAGRDRSDPHFLGNGYPKYAAALLRERFPEREFEFLNFGISGNRTWDLIERWKTDCLDWKPDILSVMIGVNDTWRAFDQNSLTTAEQYENNYRRLLREVREQTDAKILLLEPYLLPTDAGKAGWRSDLNPKIDAARRIAREFADVYIPLDGLFAAACIGQEPPHWSGDGVHPNENGAQFIASLYADAAASLLD